MRLPAQTKRSQPLQVRAQLEKLIRNRPCDSEFDIYLYLPVEQADISIEQQVEDLTRALGQNFYLHHINIYHINADGALANCEPELAERIISINDSILTVDNLSLMREEFNPARESDDALFERQIAAITRNHPSVSKLVLTYFDPHKTQCTIPVETQIKQLSQALGQNCFIREIQAQVYPEDGAYCLTLRGRGLLLQHTYSIIAATFLDSGDLPPDRLPRAAISRLQKNQGLFKSSRGVGLFLHRVHASFDGSIQRCIRRDFLRVAHFFNNTTRLQRLLFEYQQRLPEDAPQCQEIQRLLELHQAHSLLISKQGLLEYMRHELTLTPAEWQCLEENFGLFLMKFRYSYYACGEEVNVCLSPDGVLVVGEVDCHARRRFSVDPLLLKAEQACFFEANTPLYIAAQTYRREPVLQLLAQGAHPLAPCGQKRQSVFSSVIQFTAESQCALFILLWKRELITLEYHQYVDQTGYIKLRDQMIDLFISDLLARDFFSFQPSANAELHPFQAIFEEIKRILDDELGKLLGADMTAESSRSRPITSLVTSRYHTNLKLLAELVKFYERLYKLIACQVSQFAKQVVKLKALELIHRETYQLIAPQVNELFKASLKVRKLLTQANMAIEIAPGLGPLYRKLEVCASVDAGSSGWPEFKELVQQAVYKLAYDGLASGNAEVLVLFDPRVRAELASRSYDFEIGACSRRIAESEAAGVDPAIFQRRLILLKQQYEQVRRYLEELIAKTETDQDALERFFRFIEPHFPAEAVTVLRQQDCRFIDFYSNSAGCFLDIKKMLILPTPFSRRLPLVVVAQHQQFDLFVRMLALGADPFNFVVTHEIFSLSDIRLRNQLMREIFKNFLNSPVIELFSGSYFAIATHVAMIDALVEFRKVFSGLITDVFVLLTAEAAQGSSGGRAIESLEKLIFCAEGYHSLLHADAERLPVMLARSREEWVKYYLGSARLPEIQAAFAALEKAMIEARQVYGDEDCLRAPVNGASASTYVGRLFAGSDSTPVVRDESRSYQPPTFES